MSNLLRKFVQDDSGKGSQELGSVIGFSLIIFSVAAGLCYGLQHGLIYNLNQQQHSSFVASHAQQHMY
jgi:hypothetical protein